MNNNTNKLLNNVDNALKKKPVIFIKKKNYLLRNIIVFLFIIAFIVIVILIIKFIKGKYSKGEVFIDEFHSNELFELENHLIRAPLNTHDYSISLWLYINDDNKNHNFWRNIFFKGSLLTQNESEGASYSDWDNVSNDFYEQSPGLWMHPNVNNLRLAFTTYSDKRYCHTYSNPVDCASNEHCVFDNNKNKCELDVRHPKQLNNYTQYPNFDNFESYNIEYVDLINVPIKKMTHLSIVLENQILNLYLNGKLLKIHNFNGTPIFNNKSLFFNYPKSVDFSLYNFEYKPYTITKKQLNRHIKTIPNVNRFPKKYRVKNYLKNLDFKNVIRTFFN